jgi:hypothetical protein
VLADDKQMHVGQAASHLELLESGTPDADAGRQATVRQAAEHVQPPTEPRGPIPNPSADGDIQPPGYKGGAHRGHRRARAERRLSKMQPTQQDMSNDARLGGPMRRSASMQGGDCVRVINRRVA